VQQYDRFPAEGEPDGFFEVAHPGAPAIGFAEQEIPVADEEADLHAVVGSGAQTVGHLALEVADGVVADPGFEQIAEDQQATGPACRAVEKFEELSGDVGTPALQVQVGDDQRVDGRGDGRRSRPLIRPSRRR
jgi:hypothetical protein